MKSIIVYFIVFCLSLCLTATSFGSSNVDMLMELSGITKQIQQFPGLIKEGMVQAKEQGIKIPEDKFALIIESINKSIVPDDILNGIRIDLDNKLNKNEITHLLTWYRSPIGKLITLAEEKASTPEAYNTMLTQGDSLLKDTQRVAYASRLDDLLGVTDQTMDIQNFSAIAVYTAMMASNQPDKPLNINLFKAQINSVKDQTRKIVKQVVIISFVYAYQNIDMAKLKQYENFLISQDAVKFHKVVMVALNAGIENAVTQWADKLAIIFKKD